MVASVLLAVVVVAMLSLSIGDYPIAPADLWRTLWGGGDRVESYVVFQVRAPRLAMALLVGAALGAAGGLLQSLLGNPLASPDLLGISGGAGAAAVFALLILGVGGPLLAAAAFAGGIAVAAFLLLAGRHRADGGYRLILAGVGVAFLSVAITNYLMVRAQVELAQSALIWLTGSLASTPWWNVATVLVVILLATPAVVACARWLPITQMGAPTAASLGVRTSTVRLLTDPHRRAADGGHVRFRRADRVHRAVRPGHRAAAARSRRGRDRHERRRSARASSRRRTSSRSSPCRACRCPSAS